MKVEVRRRDLSTCHEGPVQQFVMAEGELITIGCDGWIRVWDLESIEQAAPIDNESEDGVFLLDPMNEIHVSPGAVLRSITKSKEAMKDDENFWFLQDAGGGIWKVDLSFSLTMKKPVKLRQCHAGSVTCLESSPTSGLLLSGGEDGRICVYDLDRGSMVNSVRYTSGVSCMLWLPIQLEKTGSQVPEPLSCLVQYNPNQTAVVDRVHGWCDSSVLCGKWKCPWIKPHEVHQVLDG